MSTLLNRDTVIVDLLNVTKCYFIQIYMYILHKTSAVSGENSLDVKTVHFNSWTNNHVSI